MRLLLHVLRQLVREQAMMADQRRGPLMVVCAVAVIVFCSAVRVETVCHAGFQRVSVLEDAVIGSTILQLGGATEAMVLLNNTDNSFSLLPNGSLVTAAVLNREERHEYVLTVVQQRGEEGDERRDIPVGVIWITVVDSVPVFDQREYSVSVPDDLSVGSQIITVTASIADNMDLFYSFAAGNLDHLFAIDSRTGNITLSSSLEYRVADSYLLTVSASSHGNNFSSEVAVMVNVTHRDTPPSFSSPSIQLGIVNVPAVGEEFGYIIASSRDSPSRGTLSYSTASDVLGIQTSTGALFLKQTFSSSSLLAEVTATKTEFPYLNATTAINISVTDQAPVFTQLNYTVKLAEDVSVPHNLLTVQANASNGASVQYMILEGSADGSVSINSSNGQLSVDQPLDHELVDSYRLLVVAISGSVQATTLVVITVENVNEQPLFARDVYKVSLPENTAVGSTVLELRAQDEDTGQNGVISYTSQDLPSLFTISLSSIVLSRPLNLKTVYSFTVTASDGGGSPLSSTARVVVTVADVNDNTPQFSGSLVATVPENLPLGAPILQLQASDADEGANAALTFSLLGPPLALRYLFLSPQGLLLTRRPLDREFVPFFLAEVRVADNGQPSLSSTATVRVTVDDVPDTAPIFLQQHYQLEYSRAIAAGDHLDTITAFVPSQSTQDIVYNLTGSDLFSIDSSNGDLSATSSLSVSAEYQLMVTATSAGLNSSVPVTVVISPSSPPNIRSQSIYLSTQSYLFPSQLPLTNVAADQPGVSGFSLQFSSDVEREFFVINSSSGEIGVKNSVDTGVYNLNVSVNGVGGVGTGSVTVRVNLPTTDSLRQAVVISLPLLPLEYFLQRSISDLLEAVSSALSCSSTSRVELVAAQSSSDGGTEVAIAVRTPDLLDYLSHVVVLERLLLHHNQIQQQLQTSVLLQPNRLCSSRPCASYQLCSDTVQLDTTLTRTATPRVTALLASFSVSFVCKCPHGFSPANNCSQIERHCEMNPCMFGGTCIELLGDYRCECPLFTSGKNCSIVCPSTSCQLCSPNPCRNGGTCTGVDGTVTCMCPPGYKGRRCELTTVHFSAPSYARLPDLLQPNTQHTFSLSFATVSPTGLLLYTGHPGVGVDMLAVEVIVGQVRVTAHIQDTMNSVQTTAVRSLSDGKWHTINIIVTAQRVTATVTDCSTSEVLLVDNNDQCSLSITLNSSNDRLVSGRYPVYVGGAPPPPATFPLLSRSFSGCVRDVMVDNTLIDLAAASTSGAVGRGCPPLGVSCEDKCGTGQCEAVWNGTICTPTGGGPSSVSMEDRDQINITSSHALNITTFSLAVRTRNQYASLVQLGQEGVIEILHGSIVYRQDCDSLVVLVTDGQVNDGRWHTLTLSLTTHLSLSVDDGRVKSTVPLPSSFLLLKQITIGGGTAPYSGCIHSSVTVNSEDVNLLTSIPSTGLAVVKTAGVANGCSSGSPCTSHNCPSESMCMDIFRDYSCSCDRLRRAEDGQCVNPCTKDPCRHGSCRINPDNPLKFACVCMAPYMGPLCDQEDLPCNVFTGYYMSACSPFSTSSFCRPCVCDHAGVINSVCDKRCGGCNCTVNPPTYSPPEDVHCQLCDCNPVGSLSTQCNQQTGHCPCHPNMAGRRCDRCNTNYAGYEDGCQAATSVEGTFMLRSLITTAQSKVCLSLSSLSSSKEIAEVLKRELLLLLQRFGLPWKMSVDQLSLSDNSTVSYRVQAYRSAPSFPSHLPSLHTLAAVMQTVVNRGRIASYTIANHSVTASCDSNPCSPGANCTNVGSSVSCGCASGQVGDGVICRSVPQGCTGSDVDMDGIPDACDNCQYLFNPDQRLECAVSDGVCPYDSSEGLLWSPVAAGEEAQRPCPAPLSGTATRMCNSSGTWQPVNLVQCLTPVGQLLDRTLEEIRSGSLVYSTRGLEQLAIQLGSLISSSSITGADLSVGSLLLREFFTSTYLLGSRNVTEQVLRPLVAAVSNMTAPVHTGQWQMADNSSGAASLLQTVETLVDRSVEAVVDNGDLHVPGDHARMLVVRRSEFSFVEWSIPGSGSVFIPRGVVNGSTATDEDVQVSLMLLSSFSSSLPITAPNATATSPVWVVHIKGGGVNPEQLLEPILITFPKPNENGTAVCVFWDHTSRQWNRSGCELVQPSSSQPECRCSHLSSFSLLVMDSTDEVADFRYKVQPFNNVVLGFTSLLLLAALVMLCARKKNRESPFQAGCFQLVVILFCLHLVFLVVQNFLPQFAVPCAVFGALMEFLLLTALVLLFILGVTLLLVARVGDHPRLKWFKILSAVAGMAVPLLYTVVCVLVVLFTQPPLSSAYGYPHYCWMAPGLATYISLAAVVIIVLLLVVVMVICTVLVCCSSIQTAANRSMHKLKFFLLFLWVAIVLFLVTWSLGWLSVAGSVWSHPVPVVLDNLFAVGNLLFVLFLVTIMSFGDDILEYLQFKFHLSTSVEIELKRTTACTATLRDLKKSSDQRESRSPQRQVLPLDLSHDRSVSSSPEPEYHVIPEQLVPNSRHPPLHGGDSNEPTGSIESDSYKTEEEMKTIEVMPEVQEGGQPWFNVADSNSRTPSPRLLMSDVHSIHSNSPHCDDDDVSSEILDELYQKGRGMPPSSTPITTDPLWYAGNQSEASVQNRLTEMAPRPVSANVEPLYAEVPDSIPHAGSLTPLPQQPGRKPHPSSSHPLGMLSNRSVSLTHCPTTANSHNLSRQRVFSATGQHSPAGNISPSFNSVRVSPTQMFAGRTHITAPNGHASSSHIIRCPDGSQTVESLC